MIGKMVYDISKDEMKKATQEDVDNIFQSLQTSGRMVRALRKLQPELVPKSSDDGSFIKELDTRLKIYLME